MEILELVDSLEDLVVQARRLPVGGNLVVDRKRMLDIIDQMRLAIPADIIEANQIRETRDQILQQARFAAQEAIDQGEQERERRIEETSLLREARERSQMLVMEAEARARQTIAEADATAAAHLSEAAEASAKQLDDADQYALEVLRRLDALLQIFVESVRDGVTSLQQRR